MSVFRRVCDYLSLDIESYLANAQDKESKLADLIWEMENQSGRLGFSVGQAKQKCDKASSEICEASKKLDLLEEKLRLCSGIGDSASEKALREQWDCESEKVNEKNMKYISYDTKYSQLSEQLETLKDKIDEAKSVLHKLKSERLLGKSEKNEAVKSSVEKTLETSSPLEWVKNKATIDAELERLMSEIKSNLL